MATIADTTKSDSESEKSDSGSATSAPHGFRLHGIEAELRAVLRALFREGDMEDPEMERLLTLKWALAEEAQRAMPADAAGLAAKLRIAALMIDADGEIETYAPDCDGSVRALIPAIARDTERLVERLEAGVTN